LAGVRFTDGQRGDDVNRKVDVWSNSARNAVASIDRDAGAEDTWRQMIEAAGQALDSGSPRHLVPVATSEDQVDVDMCPLERWADQKARLRPDVSSWDQEQERYTAWTAAKRHLAITRARRALAALRDHHVGFEQPHYQHFAVLHIVYGMPDPFIRTLPGEAVKRLNEDQEHPLAGLARYTDTVEAVRQEMVLNDAAEAMAKDAAAGSDFGGSRYRDADRRITSGDAMRRILAHGKAEREAMLTMIKVDASKLLEQASLAYLEAWRSA
jgi:hypothetical protein